MGDHAQWNNEPSSLNRAPRETTRRWDVIDTRKLRRKKHLSRLFWWLVVLGAGASFVWSILAGKV